MRINELYQQLDDEPEVTGTIVALKDFGAVVSIESLVPAFLHISEVAFSHVSDISEYLHVGQKIKARVLDITGDFTSDKLPFLSVLSLSKTILGIVLQKTSKKVLATTEKL